MTVVCPDCKTKNLPGRLHCLGCGSDLSAFQPSDEEINLARTTSMPLTGAGLSTASRELAEKVVGWYRLYCSTLLFLWLILTPVLLWLLFLNSGSSINGMPVSALPAGFADSIRQQQQERMLASLGPAILFLIPAVIAVIAALIVKPSPGSWIFHILILCLGLSGCTLPVSVLLLIHWFKPEVQTYFGRRIVT